MMEGLVSLLLLLHCTTVTVSMSCSQEGAIQIFGYVTNTLIAGHLEICVDGILRAVYDDSWGTVEARIVCQERGFPQEGARACTGSCLGASSLRRGYTEFSGCSGREALTDCGSIADDGLFPDINAGVICTIPNDVTTSCPTTSCPTPSSPTSCPTITCPSCPTTSCPTISCPAPTTPLSPTMCTCSTATPTSSSASQTTLDSSAGRVDSGEGGMDSTTVETCTVIGATLGAVSVVLLLTLVGVVMGWVWSCHRNKGKSKQRTFLMDSDMALVNPTYTPTYTPTTPSIQYSALGPRDAPTSHAPKAGGTGEEGEGGEGMAYEVPVQSRTNQKERAEEGAAYEVPVPSADGAAYAVIAQKGNKYIRQHD